MSVVTAHAFGLLVWFVVENR